VRAGNCKDLRASFVCWPCHRHYVDHLRHLFLLREFARSIGEYSRPRGLTVTASSQHQELPPACCLLMYAFVSCVNWPWKSRSAP